MLNCQDCLCVKSGEVAMERFMLLCDSCVRTGIKMVMVMSIPIKKGSSTASLKRGTFISSFLVIVPRITEGGILNLMERQTMGPAARTVSGERIHINSLEDSWMAPCLRIGSTGGLCLPFLKNFLPIGTWSFGFDPTSGMGLGTLPLSPSCRIHLAKPSPRSCSGPAAHEAAETS